MKFANLISILTFFLVNCAYAQYQESLDSISKLNGYVDIMRGFLGSSEEKSLYNTPYFIEYLEKVQKIAIERNESKLYNDLEYLKDFYVNQKSDKNEMLKENLKIAAKLIKENNHELLAAQYHTLAQNYYGLKQYALTFEYYIKAFELHKEKGFENIPIASKFLHDYALMCYFFKDYNKVIELMRISLKIKPFNSNHDIQRYNNIGSSFYQLKEFDSALHYFSKIEPLAIKYNSNAWRGIVASNIGSTYFDYKQYNKALEYYIKEFDIQQKGNLFLTKYAGALNIAKAYAALNKFDEAKKYLDISEELRRSHTLKHFGDEQQLEASLKIAYQVFLDYYEAKKNYKLAGKYKDSLYELSSKIDEKYNSSILDVINGKYNLQKKKLELETLTNAKAKQRLYYLVALSLILILSLGFIFYYYKDKLKKLRKAEQLLIANRLSLYEKQKIDKELELSRQQINRFVAKINEQNALISDFESELEAIKGEVNNENQEIVQSLRRLQEVKILTDNDWVVFKENFDKLYPNFVESLQRYCSILSNTEIRYFVLAKCGFNNKEIARVLGVSDVAIRVAWSRIRKKMDFNSNESIEDIINIIELNYGNTPI